jgi:predicted Zn-dependent protease
MIAMRRILVTAAALTVWALLGVPALSMGGGGSGGGSAGGGYGSGMGMGSTTTDDYTIAKRLIRHQQYQEAISHLQSALADKPHDADILNYLGFTKRMVGDYDASLDYYKRALAIDPNHKGVHEYLGELYLQMHDQASAQKELDTLASLCPSGCDERDTLTKAMAAYTPPATASPASATAAPATATPAASPAPTQ